MSKNRSSNECGSVVHSSSSTSNAVAKSPEKVDRVNGFFQKTYSSDWRVKKNANEGKSISTAHLSQAN